MNAAVGSAVDELSAAVDGAISSALGDIEAILSSL